MDTRSRPAEGFTVLEVIVAITVLMVSLLGAALLFETTIVVSGTTRNRVVAATRATEAIEGDPPGRIVRRRPRARVDAMRSRLVV